MFFSVSFSFFCFIFYFFKPKLFYQYLFENLRKRQLRGILLNMYVFKTKLCSLSATFFNTQQTFQRCLNVAIRVIWRRDVGQCQINIETTLKISTLRFTTLKIYNVKIYNVLCFNVDINNVRKRCNNVVIFNGEFHNVDQRWNNLVNMTIFEKPKRAKKYFWASKKGDLFD